MKCPQCAHKQEQKHGMRCAKCGYRFAIDPKQSGALTDNKLMALLQVVSSAGAYHFTENQLYAQYVRQKLRSSRGKTIVLAVVGLIFLGIAFIGGIAGELKGLAVGAGIITLIVLWVTIGKSRSVLDRNKFRHWLHQYTNEHGPIEKIISKPSLHEPPPQWKEPDIYDYGIERILIVQRDMLVDLFVRNGFHAEQRCLLVSQTGYPRYIVNRAQAILAKKPAPPVFFLHDPTRAGERLARSIGRHPPFELHGRQVVDLGLSTQDLKRMSALRRVQSAFGTVPVDAILYGALAFGIGQAFAEGLSLSTLLEKPQQEGGVSFG